MKSLEIVEKLKQSFLNSKKIDRKKQVNDWEALLNYRSDKGRSRYASIERLRNAAYNEIQSLVRAQTYSENMLLTREAYENCIELAQSMKLKEIVASQGGKFKPHLLAICKFVEELLWDKIAKENNGYDALSMEELKEFDFTSCGKKQLVTMRGVFEMDYDERYSSRLKFYGEEVE